METITALLALNALAQETRLAVFRLLVRHEPDGLAAGQIAQRVGVPQNTLSAHLSILTRAELVQSARHSRSIVYRASIEQFRGLVGFLVKDCCAGRTEICAPLLAELSLCGVLEKCQ